MSDPRTDDALLRRRTILTGSVGAALLLAGCGADDSPGSGPSGASSPGSAAPESSAAPDPAESTDDPTAASTSSTSTTAPLTLPATPSTADPAALAAQLGTAWRAVLDPRAAPADVRTAGEFWQLAVRALTHGPRPALARVRGRLGAGARTALDADVAAARELDRIGSTPTSLPDEWRIVEPRPAAELLGHYRRAERLTRVPWEYLAAINLVETRMGRILGTSTAGAQGPMQFLPTTWDIYGRGGDIRDPRDAILAAGRLLAANGAPGDMAEALWHYNPTEHYVRAVSDHAGVMRRWPRAYHGYHQWRVLYRHVDGTYVLPVGYPRRRPQLLPGG